jgi:formate dehydrogenase major subunit
MLLTRKSSSSRTSSQLAQPVQPAQSVFVDRLQRGLSQALPTLDRRGFLRRSGLGVGVGLAATQLSLVKKADAAGGSR